LAADPEIEAAFGSQAASAPVVQGVTDDEINAAFPQDQARPTMPDGRKFGESRKGVGDYNPNVAAGDRQILKEQQSIGTDTALGAALAVPVMGMGAYAAKAGAGLKGLYDIATGKGLDTAAGDVNRIVAAHQPYQVNPNASATSALAAEAMQHPANPLNWVPKGFELAGKGVSAAARGLGAGPELSQGLGQGVAEAGPLALGLAAPRGAGGITEEPEVAPYVPAPPAARQVLPGDVPVPANAPIPQELSATGAPRGALWEPSNAAPKAADPFAIPDEKGPSLELPAAEQARRGRVLSEIGLNEGYRQSAITGDPLAQSTDHQVSLSDSAGGRVLRTAINQENDALHGYSEQTVESTGGTTGADQTAATRRGNTVTGALQAISDDFDTRLKALYTEADKRAAGEATDLKGFQGVLNDDSMLTNSDRVSLRPAVNAYLKKLGVVDENGNVTASVQQAETIRKYLNENWSPQNSGFVKALKNSLDEDVTGAAGQDIYKSARALNTERANTIDNPKGISDIMDTSGPGGINRKVASDDVMKRLETMDPPQLAHIIDTLKAATGDAQPKAQAALAEIQSHFAQRAHDVGTSTATQWNVKGYNNFLKNNSESLGIVFKDNPEALHRLYTTNEAGKILHRPTQYPGAANQAYNLNKSGTIPSLVQRGITIGGAGLGGMVTGGPIGGAVGAGVGEQIGGNVAGRISTAQALKRANARIVGPTKP
jgi:hypothetical protein